MLEKLSRSYNAGFLLGKSWLWKRRGATNIVRSVAAISHYKRPDKRLFRNPCVFLPVNFVLTRRVLGAHKNTAILWNPVKTVIKGSWKFGRIDGVGLNFMTGLNWQIYHNCTSKQLLVNKHQECRYNFKWKDEHDCLSGRIQTGWNNERLIRVIKTF